MSNLSRDEWITAAFKTLCTGGIEALRVELLAKGLNVTKGSFYHHFSNRRELHMAMLNAWEQQGTDHIIGQVQDMAQQPADRLRSLAHQTFATQTRGDAIEAALRAWATTDSEVAEAATRVDERRLDYVTGLLTAHGMNQDVARLRAKLFYRALIGEFTWRTANGPTSTPEEVDELVDLIVCKR